LERSPPKSRERLVEPAYRHRILPALEAVDEILGQPCGPSGREFEYALPVDDRETLTRTVLALRPAWFAADLAGFEFLPGGYSNQNYRFRHHGQCYVLRVPQRSRPFVDRELECRFYRSPGRVLVPEIEAFDPVSGVMISHWLDGPLLADINVDPSALVPFVESLHAGLPTCPRRYDPVALARQQLSVGNPQASVVELASRLVWNPEHTTACHNDLNPWNIIRSDGDRWVTLDWEWFGENDPVFDLVTLHQGLSLDDAILVELAGELLGNSQPQSTRRRVRDAVAAFWLREYAWANAEIANGNDRDEIREQIRLSSEKLGGEFA
jgi:aminoglycoside phosphotransferase (APT) family kinase protein